MKRRFSRTFGILLVVFYTGHANAQLKLGLNGDLLLPVGTLSNSLGAGIGAGASVKYVTDGVFGVGGQVNYNLLSAGNATPGINYTVLNAGFILDYYFVKSGGSTPYLTAEFGYYSLTTHISSVGANSYGVNTSNGSFGIAPGIGYEYYINPKIAINACLKYNYTFSPIFTYASNSTQYLQLNIGLSFLVGQPANANLPGNE